MRDNLRPHVNTSVLCTAFLETYRPTEEDDITLVCKFVELYDYDRGKLLTKIDHCWLWMKQPAYQTLLKLSTVAGERMTLNDLINFCGVVEKYTRSDGTEDYGIRLRDFLVVTKGQQEKIRKEINRRFDRLTAEAKLLKLASFYVHKLRLEHNVCDWRDLAKYSKKDALTLVRRQISHLEGWLHPKCGEKYVRKRIEKELIPARKQLELELKWQEAHTKK